MGHVVWDARIPGIDKHGAPAQRLHGDGCNEMCGGISHDDVDSCTLFDQTSHEFGRLVAGDAAT